MFRPSRCAKASAPSLYGLRESVYYWCLREGPRSGPAVHDARSVSGKNGGSTRKAPFRPGPRWTGWQTARADPGIPAGQRKGGALSVGTANTAW